jgi:hypothetical protein
MRSVSSPAKAQIGWFWLRDDQYRQGCQPALTFAPSAVETATLSMAYSYTDNARTTQTGSVSIPYAGTTHNDLVATASPSGTVALAPTARCRIAPRREPASPMSSVAIH